jgi:RNA polymerase sigma-70 factor, ECF subfamily
MSSRAGQAPDGELLRRHIAGDAEAFGELFRRHRDRLWAVALRTMCDQEEAADALQDAMLSAFRRAADFRGESAVTTWLHRIVVNACLDRLRRRANRPAFTGDDDVLDALAAVSRDGDSHDGGDPSAITATRLDVDAALRILPPPQRAALVLVDMLGFSVSEAADIMGVSPGTVKSRCARSRARLLPLLSDAAVASSPDGVRGNQAPSESVSPQGGDA